MSTTVLLVDDHDLIRSGLREAFERDGAFTVVGDAGTVEAGLRLAMALRPDVTVMDVNLPDGSGLDAVKRLRADQPDMGIVVLTMYNDDDHLFAALETRASGFVPKSASTDEVLAAARHAAAAPHVFTAAGMANAMRRRLDPAKPKLSAREQEVGGGLADVQALGDQGHRQAFGQQLEQELHLQDVREARRVQPQPGAGRGRPPRPAPGRRGFRRAPSRLIPGCPSRVRTESRPDGRAPAVRPLLPRLGG